MRYAHVYHAVTQKPWLILPSKHQAIVGMLETRLGKTALEAQAEDGDLSPEDFAPPKENARIENGIAVVPIHGVMGRRLSRIEKSCGACDTGDVMNELDRVLSEGAQQIILDVRSPGGMVDGTKELGDKISEIQDSGRAQVHAFTDDQMCSAAYWVSASAYMIHATENADVGSIGVYFPWIDQTQRYKMLGYEVHLFKAGRLKGQGFPGTALSDEQKTLWQADVDRLYRKFTDHVTGRRPSVESETMQGQCFPGEIAATNGLVDNLVGSIEDVKMYLRK